MNSNVKDGILTKVYQKYTGLWDSNDALSYTPHLFPFVEPDKNVKDAIKTLECKKDKEKRFREISQSIERQYDFRYIFKEMEYFFERSERKYMKESDKYDSRPNNEMLIALMISISTQKNNVNITLDFNKTNAEIYDECKDCPLRSKCKGAFPILSGYVASALISLDFEITDDE